MDPYKVITGVSIDWKFGDGTLVRGRKNTTIVHAYNKEKRYHLWVTIRVDTKYFGKTLNLEPITKTLDVKGQYIFLTFQYSNVSKKTFSEQSTRTCKSDKSENFEITLTYQRNKYHAGTNQMED